MGVFDTAGRECHLLIDALKWVQGPKGILADNPHLAPALHRAHTMERFYWDIANGVGEGGFPGSGRANDRGQRARVDGELWHNHRGGLTIFQLNIVEMTQWSSDSGGANDSLLTGYMVINRGKGQLMKIGSSMTNMTLLNMFPVFKCHILSAEPIRCGGTRMQNRTNRVGVHLFSLMKMVKTTAFSTPIRGDNADVTYCYCLPQYQ